MKKQHARSGAKNGKTMSRATATTTARQKEGAHSVSAAKTHHRRHEPAAATAQDTAGAANVLTPAARLASTVQGSASPTGEWPDYRDAALSSASAPAPRIASGTAPRMRDGRLPPIGTKLLKHDRLGRVRCECEVTAQGFVYRSTTYRSLSAAAAAAAKDLGISTAVNGYVFFSLAKPSRTAKDPVEDLAALGEKYAARASLLLKGASSSDSGAGIRRTIEAHAKAVDGVLKAAGAA